MYGRPEAWRPGPPHAVRPLEIRVPDCGQRHAIVDMPSFADAMARGQEAYEQDRAAIRANFHQLAAKVEAMRAALQAMGIPISEKE